MRLKPASSLFSVLGLLLLTLWTVQLRANGVTVLPIGDSITEGIDYATNSAGGYRDPLLVNLSAAGITFQFVGPSASNPSPLLTGAGQANHSGLGGWHLEDLDANLDGVATPVGGGENNLGGYLLTGGHGTGRGAICADIVLLHAGTNDLLQSSQDINGKAVSLVTHIHVLCPNATILVAGIVPINSANFVPLVNAYNTYLKTQLVPSLSYTRFVDQNTGFLNADGSVNGSLLGTDLVHPNKLGYPIIAAAWAQAIRSVLNLVPAAPIPAPAPSPSPQPATYHLTVNGGSGTGTYVPGTSVTVRADPALGNYLFFSWQGTTSNLSSSTATSTTLTMPAAPVAITATYAFTNSPVAPTPAPTPSPAPAPANLGVFSVLNEGEGSGNSLSVLYGKSADGGSLVTYWDVHADDFMVLSTGQGLYEILETQGNRCLTANGTSVAIYACTGSPSQLFTLKPQADGSVLISADAVNCVEAPGGFAQVGATPCSSALAQRWVFRGANPLNLR